MNCDLCDESAASVYGLRTHMRNKHEPESPLLHIQVYPCKLYGDVVVHEFIMLFSIIFVFHQRCICLSVISLFIIHILSNVTFADDDD